jgi:hypothetical protein
MAEVAKQFKATGALTFLNDWTYTLGAEILVPKGMEETRLARRMTDGQRY